MSKSRTNRRVILAFLVSAVVVLAGAGWWWPTHGPLAFDRADWDAAGLESKKNDFRRHRMADSLIRSKSLVGKTRAEIVAMLGKPPDHFNSERGLIYMLGSARHPFPFMGDLLQIQLNDDGRVNEAKIFHD